MLSMLSSKNPRSAEFSQRVFSSASQIGCYCCKNTPLHLISHLSLSLSYALSLPRDGERERVARPLRIFFTKPSLAARAKYVSRISHLSKHSKVEEGVSYPYVWQKEKWVQTYLPPYLTTLSPLTHKYQSTISLTLPHRHFDGYNQCDQIGRFIGLWAIF